MEANLVLSQDNAKNSNIVLTSESNEMDRVRLVSDSLWADYDYDKMEIDFNVARLTNKIDDFNDTYEYSLGLDIINLVSKDLSLDKNDKVIRRFINVIIFDRQEVNMVLGFIDVVFNKTDRYDTHTIISEGINVPCYDMIAHAIAENANRFSEIGDINEKYGDLAGGIIYYINLLLDEKVVFQFTVEMIREKNRDAVSCILKNILKLDDENKINRALSFLSMPYDSSYCILSNIAKMTADEKSINKLKRILKIKDNKTIYTYLIRDNSNNMIKIGKTSNLHGRLGAIRTSNVNVEMIAFVDKDIEQELHDKYEVYAYSGEWFHLRDQMVNEIILEYGFKTYLP